MSDPTPAVQTSGLTVDFGPLRAVDHLDLRVERGRVFGFLGPNGAGKTTTIRALLGLLRPSSGSAAVLGLDVRSATRQIRARVGLLGDHLGLYDRLSALENLEFHGRAHGLERSVRRERIDASLERFGLTDAHKRTAGTFSKGMRQKLAFARAWLHRPELLFLDEPTNGLDPKSAAELRRDLRALAEDEGVTVFVTSHNLAEVDALCDDAGIIAGGRLRAEGAIEELRALAGPTTVCECCGQRTSPSLESAYLELIGEEA